MIDVIGLDISTTRIGVSLSVGSYSIERPKPKSTFTMAQLEWMANETIACLGDDAALVMVEENITGTGRGIHVPSFWLHGVIRNRLFHRGVPYVEVHQSRRSKWACGDQKSRDKDAVLLKAKSFDHTVENNDEADAAILRLMGEQAYGIGRGSQIPMTNYRRETLLPLEWPEVYDSVTQQLHAVSIPTKGK